MKRKFWLRPEEVYRGYLFLANMKVGDYIKAELESMLYKLQEEGGELDEHKPIYIWVKLPEKKSRLFVKIVKHPTILFQRIANFVGGPILTLKGRMIRVRRMLKMRREAKLLKRLLEKELRKFEQLKQ